MNCGTVGENLGREAANCTRWGENLEGGGEISVVEDWVGGEEGIGVGWNWGGEGVGLGKDLGVTADRTCTGFNGF